ncbi:unnamed protein product [Ambrosiozyma monospora]|uniref:separase n=1 Tax=Ambrosiozyma monospora TaxID=43982 RepID=A0A9W7DJH1_AMBMO|nr:unnamed protein product [Ambrosiozyma monospora]
MDDPRAAENVEDLVFFMLDTISCFGQRFAYDELDLDQLCSQIKSQLKVFHGTRSLTGLGDSTEDGANRHIVLIPFMECHRFPWESMPCLQGKSISRMPSLTMLYNVLKANNKLLNDGVSSSSGYYVINPGGDLKNTQKNFQDLFAELNGWNGVAGVKPQQQEIKNGLTKTNMYVYIGHGGGDQYIKSKAIKSMDSIPPTLLLGCSSGRLKQEGVFPPYGTAYNYLLGGCPMLLANLWDVTDKDIDKFTFELLEKWGLLVDYDSLDSFKMGLLGDDDEDSNLDMATCIAQSRSVCKLKYLNGAAPILYGLPLKLSN